MTRQIKFRAWDSEQKDMLKPFTLEQAIMRNPAPSVAELKFMQFTGLLDKNGKEIYEGDILFCGGFRDSVEIGLATGKATDSAYGVIWSDSKNLVTKPDLVDERFEIIGNIYENKELLK